MTLKNIDDAEITIGNNVKPFSDLSTKLQELNQLGQSMYVGEVSGTTTDESLYAWLNKLYLYKIESINTQLKTLSYKLLRPDVNADNTLDGIYAADDDYTAITGRKSYHYRGAVDNNWVSYAGYYWRIIRINGDGIWNNPYVV